jgi:hypothetical protein
MFKFTKHRDRVMEPDRYQKDKKHFVIGIVSLIMSMSLFGVAVYILFHILFGLYYTVPDFLLSMVAPIQAAYSISDTAIQYLVLLVIIVVALFFSGVTYFSSSHIDKEIYGKELYPDEQKRPEVKKETRETWALVLRILLIALLVFVTVELLHWAISIKK